MCPLKCRKCVKNQSGHFDGLWRQLKCVTPHQKWYHDVAHSSFDIIPIRKKQESVHRFRDIFDFVKVPIFAKISNGPGDAKN